MMTVRLSPNEEAAILRQERDRRRKLRIQQVREQERQFARKVRNEVKQRRVVELQLLAEQLQQTWAREQQEKKAAMRRVYEKNLENIGEGHKAAACQEPQDEKRAAAALLNKQAANHRHNVALENLRAEQDEQRQNEQAHILSRLTALEIEKSRAAKIAKLPPPVKEDVVDSKPCQPVKCVEDFSTTHYHATAEYVEKADLHEQGDAKAAAVQEEQRIKEQREETERELKERHEKAILRHKHAHKRALLEQDMDRLMGELGQMEQADRRRRQAVVAKIPHQVFQPPHRRMEEREEHQINLEQAFEDMYMANTEFTGDLTLALEPVVPEGDQDLDLTTDSAAGQSVQPALEDQDEADARKKPLSRTETLQKLMKRIHTQRQGWRDKSVQDLSTAPIGAFEADKASEPIPATASQTESTTTVASSSSSRTTIERSSELSQHPISSLSNNDNGATVPSIDGSETDNNENGAIAPSVDANLEPVISGSASLMHPMEHAELIRSRKFPDMTKLRRDQEHIMQRDEEQRKRLAQQQLVSHTEQQEHLHTLQRNLHQRQQALDQQIKENIGKRHEVAFGQRSALPGRDAPGLPLVQESDKKQVLSQEIKEPQNLIVRQNIHTNSATPVGESNNDHQDNKVGQIVNDPEPQSGHPMDQRPQKIHGHEPPATRLIDQSQQKIHGQGSESTLHSHRMLPNTHPSTQSVYPRQPKIPGPATVSDSQGYDDLTTNTSTSQNERIRKYQLQLLAQQRESRNALLEAQARLQQRRLNLLKEYPEISLPDYSPYVNASKGQESKVIFSRAEKELKPVSVTSEDSSRTDIPQSGVLNLNGKQFSNLGAQSADVNQQIITEQSTMPSQNKHLHASLPIPEHVKQPLTRHSDFQTGQPNLYKTHPQSQPVGPSLVTMSDLDKRNQQTLSNIASDSQQEYMQLPQNHSSAQPVMHAQPMPHTLLPAALDQHVVFREFLKNQKEKLEQRNKDNEVRLKEKQDQLREQIKRQMEQYRKVFLSEHREANEQQFALTSDSSHLKFPRQGIEQGEDLQSGYIPQIQSQEESQEIQDLSLFQRDPQVERQNVLLGHLNRSHHRPPSASRLLPDQDMLQPHELSTIIEVDTPKSERTSTAGRFSRFSPSNETAVGLGFHHYDKSGLALEEFGDQGLMTNVQRDMERLLEGEEMMEEASGMHVRQKSQDISKSESALNPLSYMQRDIERLVEDNEMMKTSGMHMKQKSPDVLTSRSEYGKLDASKQMEHREPPYFQVPSENNDIVSKPNFHTAVSLHCVTSELPNPDQYSLIPSQISPNNVDDATREQEPSCPSIFSLPSEHPKSFQPMNVKCDVKLTSPVLKSHSAISLNSNLDQHGERIGRTAGRNLLGSLSSSSLPVTSDYQMSSQAFKMNGSLASSGISSYSQSIDRGVMAYHASKIQPPTTHAHTPSNTNKPGGQKETMYRVEKDDSAMPSLSPNMAASLSLDKTPDLSAINSPSMTTAAQHKKATLSPSMKPVIEIAQPTVDNSPSYSDTSSSSQQFFTPLPNRSVGSGSSSSPDDTPSNNNSSIQWRTPKTAERGSLRKNSSNKGAMGVLSQGSTDSSGQKHCGIKWKELLEGKQDVQNLSNQSGVSVISEHSMTIDQRSLLQTTEVGQYRNIQIASVPDMSWAERDNQQNMSDLIQQDRGHTLQTVSLHQDSLDPLQKHVLQQSAVFERHSSGSYRRSQHSEIPSDQSYSYTGFLPSHHSSKISDSGQISVTHGGDPIDLVNSRQIGLVSNQSPSEVPPHLRTDVILPDAPDLSEHTINASMHSIIQDSNNTNLVGEFDQSRSRFDPSKGSFSSIEEARSQPDQDGNFRLMPMFSDVSISQQSVSFDSEQGHGVNQGQSSSAIINPTPAMSDRYSLPRAFMNEGVTGGQLAAVDGGPQMVFQRWRERRSEVGRSEVMDQSSADNGENHFQPLQEITSSTLTGYGDTGSIETGILEEPDLTLVSLNTTQYSVEQDHLHQSRIELMVADNPNVFTFPVGDQNAGPIDKDNVHPSDTSDGSGLSLQEAFARRKAGFIKASKTRQQDVKIRATDQGATAVSAIVSKKKPAHKAKALPVSKLHGKYLDKAGGKGNITADSSDNGSSTQSSAKRKKKVGDTAKYLRKADGKDNITADSSDNGSSKQSSTKGTKKSQGSTDVRSFGVKGNESRSKTTTSAGRKAAEQEMKKRTSRLYNQLEEVKQRKLEKDRQQQYAVYRQKRKDFELKLQNRLNKWANHKSDE